jgi:hypothetical protein
MTTTASEGSIFPYFIPARSVVRVTTTGDAEAFTTGFVEVIPDLGSVTPGSFVFLEHGEETSATLEAQAAANRFRVYAENHPGAETQLPHRTALAITNSSEAPATLLLEMTSADGTPTGVSTTVTMPPRTQISRFLDEIPGLEAAPAVFRGLVTITVTSGTGVTVTSVQTLYNEDIVFLMTTTGPIREDATDAAYTVFPYIPTGAQYTTSVILFGPANGAPTSGTLRTWDANGKQLFLLLE